MSEEYEFFQKYVVTKKTSSLDVQFYFRCPFCGETIDITRPSSGGRPMPHSGVIIGHLNKHIKKFYERYIYRHVEGRWKDYHYRCLICGKDFNRQFPVMIHIVTSHLEIVKEKELGGDMDVD